MTAINWSRFQELAEQFESESPLKVTHSQGKWGIATMVELEVIRP